MKPKTFSASRILLAILIVGLTVGLVSWDHRQSPGRNAPGYNDTIPKTKTSKDKKPKDLDEVIAEIEDLDLKETMEKARKELAEAMKQFDGARIELEIENAVKSVDIEKIMKEVRESLKDVDMDKIKLEIESAMKSVDMEKIMKEAKESMAHVDMSKIREELAEAMKSFDSDRILKEVRESMEKVDMDKLREELGKVKDIDMKKLHEEMAKLKQEMANLKDLGPELHENLEKAKVELEKAKSQLKEYKEFVDGLEKDGLIDKKGNYSIEHKNGELQINGKKVSEQVYSKYRSFLEKYKKFRIEKDGDDFDLDMD